ncbi:Bug family tripartite tricarboxylate transporter substrate binding protein [Humitalea sp. 24SJ18S-53]|uniref:Bug family tripartite tricarboxylate transporter substrate binding protein n=1 Tax=Humitalea sp. 24SJ18S-53 TaxID=3422307 RepID=UPI003D672E64
MKTVKILVAALAAFCVSSIAQAQQEFPNRNITLVVPFPAGSTTDTVARRMAEYWRPLARVPVLVDNRPGADGNIAASFVLRAPADGHTIFVTGNSVHGANPNIYRQMPFDAVADFAPVAGVMSIPMILTVRADFQARTIGEFIELAKNRQPPFLFASGNMSTLGSAELFGGRAGIPREHVPYRGSPQVVTDLLGGQFSWAFIDALTSMSHIQNGSLRALAVTSATRLPSLPNVPTVAESGFTGFEMGAWVGLVVPVRTPQDVVDRLSRWTLDFANDPATVQFLAQISATPLPYTAPQLRAFINNEVATWSEIVSIGNIERK